MKNRLRSIVNRFRLICAAVLGLALSVLPLQVNAAEFLSPLPVQELEVGEPYRLGIRPSTAPARSATNAKLSLYVDGLSPNAAFHRTGDELWEFTWLPTAADQGVHVVRILVTERDTPADVIEVEEMTFIVRGVDDVGEQPVPKASSLPAEKSVELAAEAVLPSKEALEVANASLPPAQNAVAVAPLVSTDLAEESITVQPLSSSSAGDSAETEAIKTTRPAPIRSADWSLAPIASQIVTPHQWVRFPVRLISDSDTIDDRIALQVDRLPNGASFDVRADGGRQFEWRPTTSDQGEHLFQFTAIDTEDGQRRESATMRIIVQE